MPKPSTGGWRRRRGVVTLAAGAMAALLLASCSSTGNAASAANSSSGAKSEASASASSPKYTKLMKEATAVFPDHYEGPTDSNIPPKGIKIAAIECAATLDGCRIAGQTIAAIAPKIGWQGKAYNGGGTATQQAQQILNAVSWGANVIVLLSVVPSQVSAALQAAEAKHILIVSGFQADEPPNPVIAPQPGQVQPLFDVSADYTHLGTQLAQWVIASSKGKAHLAVFLDQEFASIVAQSKSFLAEMKTCKTCKVYPGVDFTVGQGAAYGQEVVSFLRTHPDVNYVYSSFDIPATYAISAIDTAGMKGRVKLIGDLGDQVNLQDIAQGNVEAADASYDNTYMGYAIVDQVIRLLNHKPLFSPENENMPSQVVDSSNVGSNPTTWTAPFSYKDQFLKNWGVAG